LVDHMKLILSQLNTYRTMRDFFAEVDDETEAREPLKVGF